MQAKIKIGAVSYLNTKPLVYHLDDIAPYAHISYDLPSRLADQLASGELDVALIPSVEYFQDTSYEIVSDACIGCRGPVLSVKLLTRVPFDQIRTLALDEGSRTSVTLARILLQQRFGLTPQLESLPIGAGVNDTTADAVLLIGDRAMNSPAGGFVDEWDLGDQWCRWSELPFVFAMWVSRSGVDTTELVSAFEKARDEGVANLKLIAAQEASAVGLSEPECLSYLRDNLYFHLGQREQRGLELFRHHAVTLGMAPVG
ncbi:MAG: menaquinone biosynthesis protein [Planctomycetota bacterium]|nr:menaquinone biosynthesis protein [Planctomycetota bacterium]